jgi:predicted RNA-binding protein with PIN domain
MTYLVDGNNVMAQRVGWHQDKAGARRHLVDQLSRFARSVDEPFEVVFDGPPDPVAPDWAPAPSLLVHYAGRGSDADSRIRQLVQAAPDPRDLLVVTSDRALAASVEQLGARVARSGDLRRHLDTLSSDQ